MNTRNPSEPIKKICCYKCGTQQSLIVEEKVDTKTGKVVEKNFICLDCAGGSKAIFGGKL